MKKPVEPHPPISPTIFVDFVLGTTLSQIKLGVERKARQCGITQTIDYSDIEVRTCYGKLRCSVSTSALLSDEAKKRYKKALLKYKKDLGLYEKIKAHKAYKEIEDLL